MFAWWPRESTTSCANGPAARLPVQRRRSACWLSFAATGSVSCARCLPLPRPTSLRKLGISQKRVSEIERGQVDFTKVDTLRRYADALGASLRVEVQVGDVSYGITRPRVGDSSSDPEDLGSIPTLA